MARKLHVAGPSYVLNRDDTIDLLIESPKSPFSEGDRLALQIARSELLGRLVEEFIVGNKMRTREVVHATLEDELPDSDDADEDDKGHIKTKSKLRTYLSSLRSRKPVKVHADDEEIEAMTAGVLGCDAHFGKQGIENSQRIFEAQRRADEYARRPHPRLVGLPVPKDELEAMTPPSTSSVLKARRAK